MVGDTVAMWMTAHSPSLLNAAKVVELEKVSFSDIQNSQAFC